MEKALPLFHDRGIYPSVNLGLNRNLTQATMGLPAPDAEALESPENSPFFRAFSKGFSQFYQQAVNMGFTIANACYPMSISPREKSRLDAVYAATSRDRAVCFTPMEKALVYKALMLTIPKYRSKLRIFSPSLHWTASTGSIRGRKPPPLPAGAALTFSTSAVPTATPIPAATEAATTWVPSRRWMSMARTSKAWTKPPPVWPVTGSASGIHRSWEDPSWKASLPPGGWPAA